jgi:hypothetical protein
MCSERYFPREKRFLLGAACREDKSATSCEHGSIGENGADIVCGTNWVEDRPRSKPGCPLSLGANGKKSFLTLRP